MTRTTRNESHWIASWVHHLIYLNQPRLSLVLRWCVGLTLVALVFYAANQKMSNGFQTLSADAISGDSLPIENRNNNNNGSVTTSPEIRSTLQQQQRHSLSVDDIDAIIRNERLRIRHVLRNYTFKPPHRLNDYLMESGGNPIRALVTTTWRSGSTFLGDILLSHPATFYHYEPLLHFGIEQVRYGIKSREALRTLKSLFNCDYSKLGSYTSYGIDHNNLFTHNFPLWRRCQQVDLSLCWNQEFLTKMCKLFPFQSMKTVRLRMNLTQILLEDSSLNIRTLLLVRDPRGTMESRHHRDWCPENADCYDPGRLCTDMVDDYQAAQKLMKKFPGRVMVIRYEDFSSDPYKHTKEVFDFFGFSFHQRVQSFLDTHTKINYGGVSSTFRDTKTAPFQWRKKLNFTEVQTIQTKCSKAMKLWGYKMATSSKSLEALEPLLPWNFTAV